MMNIFTTTLLFALKSAMHKDGIPPAKATGARLSHSLFLLYTKGSQILFLWRSNRLTVHDAINVALSDKPKGILSYASKWKRNFPSA
jgi:hypothetical protein